MVHLLFVKLIGTSYFHVCCVLWAVKDECIGLENGRWQEVVSSEACDVQGNPHVQMLLQAYIGCTCT